MGRTYTHFVVIKNADGVVERQMKHWLRKNPQYIPEGMTARTHSYYLRCALVKQGWKLEMRTDKFFLHGPPNGDTSFPDDEDEEQDSLEDEMVIEAAEITFGLERDLQKALRANIDQLETGLKIVGEQINTKAGFIDIKAEDAKGNIVVIELKAGTAQPEAVTQVLAYMGAVADVDKLPVRGILVAGDFHKRVIFASHAIPNLELRRYSFHFKFDSMK